MKKITKLLLLLVTCTSLLTLTGCGEKNVEGSLEELMTKMYADFKEEELPMMGSIEVDEENVEGFFSVCNTGISNDGAPRLHDIEAADDLSAVFLPYCFIRIQFFAVDFSGINRKSKTETFPGDSTE